MILIPGDLGEQGNLYVVFGVNLTAGNFEHYFTHRAFLSSWPRENLLLGQLVRRKTHSH